MELSMCFFNLLGYFKKITARHYWIALVFCFFQVPNVFAYQKYYGLTSDEAKSNCMSGQSDNTCQDNFWEAEPACSSFVTAETPYWRCVGGGGPLGSWPNCGYILYAECKPTTCDTTEPQHWDADKMECVCNDGFERNRDAICVRPCDNHWAYNGKKLVSGEEINDCKSAASPIPDDHVQEKACQTLQNPILYGTGGKLQNEVDFHSTISSLSITRQYLSRLGVGKWYWQNSTDKRLLFDASNTQSFVTKRWHDINENDSDYCDVENINPCIDHFDYTISPSPEYVNSKGSYGYWLMGNGEKLVIQSSGTNVWQVVGRHDVSIQGVMVDDVMEFHLNDRTGKEEIYDANGYLIKIIDMYGKHTTFTYITDEDGLADIDKIIVTDEASGKKTTYIYNNSNQLVQAIDPDNQVYVYQYANGNLAKVTFPDLSQVKYHYSGAFPSALSGITDIDTDGDHRFATWGYDANGRANSSVHGNANDGSTSEQGSIAYTLNGTDVIQATHTNALGRVTNYHLTNINGQNLVTHVEGETANTCLASDSYYNYDDYGYQKYVTDKNRNVTETLRNASGLIELERSGLKWANGIVNSTLVETPTSQKILTTWHATLSLPLVRTWYKWNADSQIWEAVKQTSTTYTNTNRISTYTETDLQTQVIPYATNGNSRTWTYTYIYADVAETQLQQMVVNGPRSDEDVTDTTTYNYGLSGNITSIVNAKGHTTTFANYNSRGQVGLITDANGNTIALAYDVRGRLITVTKNDTLAATYTYWPNGLLQKVSWLTNWLSYEYNDARHLIKVTAGSGTTITGSLEFSPSLLDGKWTQIVKKSAAGVPIAQRNRVFDELGRIMTLQGQAGQAIQLGYDANDNLINENDALARLTTYQYDAQNHPEKLTDAEQNTKAVPASVNIQHDGLGQITAVTDQRGNTTAYVYDGFGNVIQQSSPDTGVTFFYYDEADNLTKKIDASGRRTDYIYDELNRLIREQAKWQSGAVADEKTYDYDATVLGNKGLGKLTYYSAGMDHTDISYNQWGVSALTDCVSSTQCFSTTYNYNNYGKITSVVYPSGDTVQYGYNWLWQVNSVKFKAAGETTFTNITNTISRQFMSGINKIEFANGITMNMTYNADEQIKTITAKNSSDTILYSKTYNYDAVNNIDTIVDNLNAAKKRDYDYDKVDRLTAETKGTTSVTTTNYTYDAVGNRRKRIIGDETETYGYPADKNRLARITKTIPDPADLEKTVTLSDIKPCYTVNGNIAGMMLKERTCGVDGYIQHYSYNLFSRMSGTDVSVAGPADYTINALGQRVVKDVDSTTYYQYSNDGKLLAEHPLDVPAQTDVAEYIYADDLPIAYVVKKATGNKIYYIVSDHLGTPQLITNQSQAVVWKADYDAFGKAAINPELITFNLRFPGQYFDKETELHYNYYRDYDPSLGRYVQSDPIGILKRFDDPAMKVAMELGVPLNPGGSGFGGLNHLYGYVGQNPIMYIDIFGLFKGLPDPTGKTCRRKGEDCEERALRGYNECLAKNGLGAVSACSTTWNGWGEKCAADASFSPECGDGVSACLDASSTSGFGRG